MTRLQGDVPSTTYHYFSLLYWRSAELLLDMELCMITSITYTQLSVCYLSAVVYFLCPADGGWEDWAAFA
jgi:hypothetical protein